MVLRDVHVEPRSGKPPQLLHSGSNLRCRTRTEVSIRGIENPLVYYKVTAREVSADRSKKETRDGHSSSGLSGNRTHVNPVRSVPKQKP